MKQNLFLPSIRRTQPEMHVGLLNQLMNRHDDDLELGLPPRVSLTLCVPERLPSPRASSLAILLLECGKLQARLAQRCQRCLRSEMELSQMKDGHTKGRWKSEVRILTRSTEDGWQERARRLPERGRVQCLRQPPPRSMKFEKRHSFLRGFRLWRKHRRWSPGPRPLDTSRMLT